MSTLLGHLARFSSFGKQSELLCTQGLAHLLKNRHARAEFAHELSAQTGFEISGNVTWPAEPRQSDRGRPDLEARTRDGKAIIKIEAKLGAGFNSEQFRSFVEHLQHPSGRGLLLVLVPRHRVSEAADAVAEAFDLTAVATQATQRPHWHLTDRPGIAVAVMIWDEVVAALSLVTSEPFASEVKQFEAMYRVLNGYDIAPLASAEELLALRDGDTVAVSLVDRVTRRLHTEKTKIMPLYVEPDGGRLRYFNPAGSEKTYCSIGVHDCFAGHNTSIWLRFHHEAPMYAVIRDRLKSSSFAQRLVENHPGIWYPLDVPLNVDGEQMVNSLVAQVEKVIEVAVARLSQ